MGRRLEYGLRRAPQARVCGRAWHRLDGCSCAAPDIWISGPGALVRFRFFAPHGNNPAMRASNRVIRNMLLIESLKSSCAGCGGMRSPERPGRGSGYFAEIACCAGLRRVQRRIIGPWNDFPLLFVLYFGKSVILNCDFS